MFKILQRFRLLKSLINEIAKHKVDGKIHEPQEATRTAINLR